ncbi:lipopolysaccharide biosynthesis protein [Flavitalea antarctica]
MSVSKRIISGSAASWARILLTIVSQVALIPLYLSYWSVESLGVWLIVQGLITLITTFDFGFQTFVEFEFLKLDASEKSKISTLLSSGLVIGIILSCFQVLLIIGLIAFGILPRILSTEDNVQLTTEGSYLLLSLGVNWLFCSSIPGLIGRSLYTAGYFPRVAWWSTAVASIYTLAAAVAVVCGGGVVMSGVVGTIASIILTMFFLKDLQRLLRKQNIVLEKPSLKTGMKYLGRSTAISANTILDVLRQQGIRIFLAPITGVASLATFSTTRTISNFAMQGLNTVMNPLMPELMGFIHRKDQDRFESAFSMVWMIIIAIIAPGFIFLQLFIGPLFEIWTRGKIALDPALFAILSQTVLVFSIAQPAIAIIKGNNILRPQVLISIIVTAIVLVSIIVLVPSFGLPGAGAGLLLAETVGAVLFQMIALKWVAAAGLRWPTRSFRIVVSSVLVTGVALFLLTAYPQFKYLWWLSSTIILFINASRFVNSLPAVASKQLFQIMRKFTGRKLANSN